MFLFLLTSHLSSWWWWRQRSLTKRRSEPVAFRLVLGIAKMSIGLASDDVTKLSNAWQRWKLVLNKGSVPYISMLGEKSLTWRSSLFLRIEVRTVLATPSLLSASHLKRYWRSDKCGAVFRTIDDLPACFCMGRYLCLEPILPVTTPVAGLWRSTCKPYYCIAGNFRQWKFSSKATARQFVMIRNLFSSNVG